MGYDLHITRKEEWSDEDESNSITLNEWKDYLQSDKEMRLDGFAEANLQDGQVLRMEDESLAIWKNYSGDGINGNHAWFSLSQGNITVKNPDEEIIKKMLEIAGVLNARVQGDDGEFYGKD